MNDSVPGINRDLAVAAVRWARSQGVGEVVLCAGARDLPLVVAWLHAPGVRTWNHPEERSAAFFATGRIQAGAGPVAVVVTSGTAAAELLPAAIEARLQGLPLLLLTADRPHHFRGTGAPQTIIQPGLFGDYAPTLADAARADDLAGLDWDRQAPAHINLCFDEPLLANIKGGDFTQNTESAPGVVPPSADWDGFGENGRLLVVLGKLDPAERELVAEFLRKMRAPVWVESSSGLWGDSRLGKLWIRDGEAALAAGPTHVLRLGGVPCGRFWRDLESRPEIQVRSVSRQGWSGLGRASETVRASLECAAHWEPAPSESRTRWAREVRESDAAMHAESGKRIAKTFSEKDMYRLLYASIPPGARVFLGNSLPVRFWQAVAPWRGGLDCYSNRGANGIDGEVSSFLGVAEGADEAWGVFGDLTALYDLAGPWVIRQMQSHRLRLVVVNNQGGGIFARLPALRGAPDSVRAVVCNQHDLDFRPWAEFWGLGYRLVADPRNPNALADLPDESVLIEMRIPLAEIST